MKALQKSWKSLTPAERKTQLAAAANKQLAKSGVPPIGIADDPNPNNDGTMDFTTWNLNMNPKYVGTSDMTDAQLKDMTDTVYHESRHGEQWYLVARKEAAAKKSAQEIHNDTGIDSGTAASAQANPLPANDPMSNCATAMNNSVYGSGSAHREKVLDGLNTLQTKQDQATANLNKVLADPSSTAIQKRVANDQVVAATKAYNANYQQYRNLPEEADAWATGGSASNLLPATPPAPAPPAGP